jgi:ubiquinone biosynthesis monooxygenase Coq7
MDQLIIGLDKGIRLANQPPSRGKRPNPASGIEEENLSQKQRLLASRLMRVNHAGEISAQALYQGQAMTAEDSSIKQTMNQSAEEEIDHLDWCEQRIDELGGKTSLLAPVWYLGSLAIGATAGVCGDKWSLGFIAETEHQVVRHLEEHLNKLPMEDSRSRVILEKMVEDESHHATVALESGGVELPTLIKKFMRLPSKIMTSLAFWV